MASIRTGGGARAPGKRPPKHASSSSTSSPPRPSCENANGEEGGANVDRVLFKNLVDMVPLVESLMDRKPNPSFRRRASVVYTPTPQPRKAVDQNGKVNAQPHSTKKQIDRGDDVANKEPDKLDAISGLSSFSSNSLLSEELVKNGEELKMLREQFEELQKIFLEKDEALRALKDTTTEMNGVNETLRELKQQIMEKDSLMTNANLQLTNTEIKLEERQAALEKLELEVTESNSKIEELQGVLDSTNFEITAFLKFFNELSKIGSDAASDGNATFGSVDHLPHIDDIDELDIHKMEEARLTYIAAVATAKENPSEECLAAAAEARFQLQSLVMNCH
ncbi:protein MICROTUBULE BINDING PROTEIN 2C-like [Curcuma longa]|uniref:protein MICROTUBULE BINDING PROTEIN 2C-like n=1 Tax=Curcuma longa TaxID=136217 RepID=UPI003D9DB56B